MRELLIAVAACAVALLVFVFSRGAGRRWRFQQFANEFGGEFSTDDAFGLAEQIDTLFGSGEKWVGYAARLQTHEGTVFLADLHDEIDGPPLRTIALCDIAVASTLPDIVVRESVPSSQAPDPSTDERYELEGADWSELPAPFTDALTERPLPSADPDHDWLAEIRVVGTLVGISSRDRPLAYEGEWRALVSLVPTHL